MKYSFEVPKNLLKKSRKFNDYDYYLDIFDDEDTKEFFKESLRKKRTVYLDNSLYERNKYNFEFNEDSFLKTAQELNEHGDNLYVVVPDKKDNGQFSINRTKLWIKQNPKMKFIITIHGSSATDYINNFKQAISEFGSKHIIALSGMDTFFQRTNITRTEIFKNIIELLGSERFNKDEIRVHFLGLRNPLEIKEISRVRKYIYSIDTSFPVTSTIEGLNILDNIEKNYKPKTLIYDVFYEDLDIDTSLLNDNIRRVKTLL